MLLLAHAVVAAQATPAVAQTPTPQGTRPQNATPQSATPPAAMLQGQDLHRALVGLWCNSADQGRTCWAHDEFFDDGRFEACGRTDDDVRGFFGAGQVTVQGRRMCYVVTRASANFWLAPGQRYCTDITAIDEGMHRYRDLDTGAEFTLWRRPRSDRQCPPTAAP